MARMFPSRFPDGAPGSERKVYNALSKLDGDWTVFHSVAWQGMRGNRQPHRPSLHLGERLVTT